VGVHVMTLRRLNSYDEWPSIVCTVHDDDDDDNAWKAEVEVVIVDFPHLLLHVNPRTALHTTPSWDRNASKQ